MNKDLMTVGTFVIFSLLACLSFLMATLMYWLCIRKEEDCDLSENTFYLVPIGFYGKELEKIEAILLACYDSNGDNYQAVSKVDIDSKEYSLYFKKFLQVESFLEDKPFNYNVSEKLMKSCTFWLKSELICNISSNSLQRHTKFRGAVDELSEFEENYQSFDEEDEPQTSSTIDNIDDLCSISSQDLAGLGFSYVHIDNVYRAGFFNSPTSSKRLFRLYQRLRPSLDEPV